MNEINGVVAHTEVSCYGESDVTATHGATVHAYDDTRVTIPKGAARVRVYAHDHAEVEAATGMVHADGYARVFLDGTAAGTADGRSLVVVNGRSMCRLIGGTPTLKRLSREATIDTGGLDVQETPGWVR
jgi:hypothetical protein